MRKSEALREVESPFGTFYVRAMVGGFSLDASSGHIGGGPENAGYDGLVIFGRHCHATIDVCTTGDWSHALSIYGSDCTPPAIKAIRRWVESVRDELAADPVIRQGVALTTLVHAGYDVTHAQREIEEAQKALAAARAKFKRCVRKRIEAAAALADAESDPTWKEATLSIPTT